MSKEMILRGLINLKKLYLRDQYASNTNSEQ